MQFQFLLFSCAILILLETKLKNFNPGSGNDVESKNTTSRPDAEVCPTA